MTEKKLEAIKSVVDFARIFAEEIYKAMKNAGITDELSVAIDPDALFSTLTVRFGDLDGKDRINLARGERNYDWGWRAYGKNSPEYELLFADAALAEKLKKNGIGEKPLPPDGLWISIHDDPPVLDSGV